MCLKRRLFAVLQFEEADPTRGVSADFIHKKAKENIILSWLLNPCFSTTRYAIFTVKNEAVVLSLQYDNNW